MKMKKENLIIGIIVATLVISSNLALAETSDVVLDDSGGIGGTSPSGITSVEKYIGKIVVGPNPSNPNCYINPRGYTPIDIGNTAQTVIFWCDYEIHAGGSADEGYVDISFVGGGGSASEYSGGDETGILRISKIMQPGEKVNIKMHYKYTDLWGLTTIREGEFYNKGTSRPGMPIDFKVSNPTINSLTLSWTKGIGADSTYILRKIGDHPTSPSDGDFVYNGGGTSVTDTGLNPGTKYYYSAWGLDTDAWDFTGSQIFYLSVADSRGSGTTLYQYYTLTVNIVGSGSVSKSPDQSSYVAGSTVRLTANPDPGWKFNGWSVDISGSTNPYDLVMNSNKVVTVTFTQDTYTLNVGTSGSGSVTKSPDKSSYNYNENVLLTAYPNTGWKFNGWSGDISGLTNPYNLVMNSNKDVIANFILEEYTLTVNTVGSGSVSKSPDKSTYHYGDPVTLSASANTGWIFSSWGQDLYGSENPKTITMDSSKVVTATFILDGNTLTINYDGCGSVTKNPDQPAYPDNTIVTLTAIPCTGWTFSHWTGDLTGTNNPIMITMDTNKVVTATFIQIEYTLTVNIVGGGSVTISPDKSTYHYGDPVTLSASANTGWIFSSWSGDLSGSDNPVSITIDGNKYVTATFTQLLLNVNPTTLTWTDVPMEQEGNTGSFDVINIGSSVLYWEITEYPTAEDWGEDWSIGPKSGTLAPGEATTVTVIFTAPNTRNTFNAKIKVVNTANPNIDYKYVSLACSTPYNYEVSIAKTYSLSTTSITYTFTAIVNPSAPSGSYYTYSWTISGNGINTLTPLSSLNYLTKTFTSSGTYSITVNVYLGTTKVTSQSTTITVSLSSYSVSFSQTYITSTSTSKTYKYTASVSPYKPYGNYKYSWTIKYPNGMNIATSQSYNNYIQRTFTTSGTYTITVNVYLGGVKVASKTQTYSITVSSSSSSDSSSSNPSINT